MWTRNIRSVKYFVFLLFFAVTAQAQQQPLTQQQQCTNYQQELVLSDISYQELRARCGNIMRQAYELEKHVQELKNEVVKLKEEVAKLKEQVKDATGVAE